MARSAYVFMTKSIRLIYNWKVITFVGSFIYKSRCTLKVR